MTALVVLLGGFSLLFLVGFVFMSFYAGALERELEQIRENEDDMHALMNDALERARRLHDWPSLWTGQ